MKCKLYFLNLKQMKLGIVVGGGRASASYKFAWHFAKAWGLIFNTTLIYSESQKAMKPSNEKAAKLQLCKQLIKQTI